MFRLWGRIWKDNHMLKDTVICDDRQETRTHKVFHCLEQICYEDNFIEQIDFDYLEIQVIEEDGGE